MNCPICEATRDGYIHHCDCYKTAYRIFEHYGYQFVPHSGGCCNLVRLLNEPTEYDNRVLHALGWSRASHKLDSWWGPWEVMSSNFIFENKERYYYENQMP